MLTFVKQLIQMINTFFRRVGIFSTRLKPSSDNFLTAIAKFLFLARRLDTRFYPLPHQGPIIIFKKQRFIGFQQNKYSQENTCLKVSF